MVPEPGANPLERRVVGVAGAAVDYPLYAFGVRVRRERGRSIHLLECVPRDQVTKRPAPFEGEFGEVRDVVTSPHSERYAVLESSVELRDHVRQDPEGLRPRSVMLP